MTRALARARAVLAAFGLCLAAIDPDWIGALADLATIVLAVLERGHAP